MLQLRVFEAYSLQQHHRARTAANLVHAPWAGGCSSKPHRSLGRLRCSACFDRRCLPETPNIPSCVSGAYSTGGRFWKLLMAAFAFDNRQRGSTTLICLRYGLRFPSRTFGLLPSASAQCAILSSGIRPSGTGQRAMLRRD